MLNRIAVLADSTESLEPLFLKKKWREKLFPLVLKSSGMEVFVLKNFEATHVISVSMKKKGNNIFSFEELPWNSDLSDKLKTFHITHLLAPYPCTKRHGTWAKKNTITLLTTPSDLQQKLENKHYFDSLLKQHGISSPRTKTHKDISRSSKKGCLLVVQRLLKNGSYTTKVKRRKDIQSQGSPFDFSKALIREFVDGIPLGISVFLDREGNYFYSGVRRQCFSFRKKSLDFKNFTGIQWIPSSFFSTRATQNISAVLDKLTKILMNHAYYGVANIDFILDKEEVYILECNPRLSSATPQVFSVPFLTSSRDPWRFFINSLSETANKKCVQPLLPVSKFSGATLDLDIVNKKKRAFPIAGVYAYTAGRIEFVSKDMSTFSKHSKRFAFIHEMPYPGYKKESTIPCSIISNFPLYDFNTGALNEKGREISCLANNT